MPSFKTVSEHCKCPVLDEQLSGHETSRDSSDMILRGKQTALVLYAPFTLFWSYLYHIIRQGGLRQWNIGRGGPTGLQFCPHWFAVFCMATLRVIKGAPNCKIIIAICPATGMIFPGTSSRYGLCTPFFQLRPWVITKNWNSKLDRDINEPVSCD